MAINRNALIGMIVVGTTGLMVQAMKREKDSQAKQLAEKKNCECMGNQQQSHDEINVEKSSFSNVYYGAQIDPQYLKAALLNFGGHKAKARAEEKEERKAWESVRGPK